MDAIKTAKVWIGERKGITSPIHVSQYDTGWTFVLTVYKDDVIYTSANPVTVVMEGLKSDGTTFAVPGTFEDGVATIVSTVAMTAAAGIVECELRLSEGGETVGTGNFDMVVEPSPVEQGTPSEDDYTAMQTLLDDMAELHAETVENAAAAEAAASTAAQEVLAETPEMIYDWLEANVTPETGYVIDRSLTVQGAAADAKAAGDRLTNLETDLAEYEGIFTADVDESVQNWLDEHPEATTTVQDHSLTFEKLVNGTLGYVTPEMYGAKGDGVTDDTQALNDALANGHTVLMTGAYLISDTVTLHSHLALFGNGQGKIIKNSAAATDFAALSYYGDGITDVTIDGLEIVGVKHWIGLNVSGNANDIGIRINNGNGIVISRNRVTDCGATAISIRGRNFKICDNIVTYTGTFSGSPPNYNFGIEYNGTSGVIENNVISGVIQGIISGLTNKQVVISKNDISTNGQHGLYMEGADGVIVTDNHVHDCSLAGVKFQLNDNTVTVFTSIVIAQNNIHDCGEQGVLVAKLSGTASIEDVEISNNLIANAKRTIDVQAASKLVIEGNICTVKKPGEYGVYLVGVNDVTVANNRIYTTDAYAIYFANDTEAKYFKNVIVSGNTILSVKTTSTGNHFALRVYAMIHGLICNNLVIAGDSYMTGTDGIYLANAESSISDLIILGNVCRGFRWDLRATYATGTTARNNFVTTITGITQS